MSAAPELVVAASAGVSAVCVVVATGFGVRQLREAHTANRFVALARVTDMLIDPEVMKARRWVSANARRLKAVHFADLDAPERVHLEEVWRAYDRVGLLFDHDLIIDEGPVLEMWGYSIVRTYELLEHLLIARRTSFGNPKFSRNFESLYNHVKGLRADKVSDDPPSGAGSEIMSDLDAEAQAEP